MSEDIETLITKILERMGKIAGEGNFQREHANCMNLAPHFISEIIENGVPIKYLADKDADPESIAEYLAGIKPAYTGREADLLDEYIRLAREIKKISESLNPSKS